MVFEKSSSCQNAFFICFVVAGVIWLFWDPFLNISRIRRLCVLTLKQSDSVMKQLQVQFVLLFEMMPLWTIGLDFLVRSGSRILLHFSKLGAARIPP
mmetsp:Transcript_10350/g.16557  ORF Transcript_10350/g.16557 Transcript_10350/m.16557 type:complete len:97 (+) Transcript_10350:56-346(+)